MTKISLTLYTNGFYGSILKSPIQMGSLSVNNSVTNISRLGIFKQLMKRAPCLMGGSGEGWGEGSRWVRAAVPGRLSSPRPPSVEAAAPRSRWWWEASPSTKEGVNNKKFRTQELDSEAVPLRAWKLKKVTNTLSSEFPLQSTYIPRVPQCMSPRWNWGPAPPPTPR